VGSVKSPTRITPSGAWWRGRKSTPVEALAAKGLESGDRHGAEAAAATLPPAAACNEFLGKRVRERDGPSLKARNERQVKRPKAKQTKSGSPCDRAALKRHIELVARVVVGAGRYRMKHETKLLLRLEGVECIVQVPCRNTTEKQKPFISEAREKACSHKSKQWCPLLRRSSKKAPNPAERSQGRVIKRTA
jgi:hypothetical protein